MPTGRASYGAGDELPKVCVVIPVHNESAVIADKLRSVLDTDYPLQKLHILIGLDACTDDSGSVIAQAFPAHPAVQSVAFAERKGKPAMLNSLIQSHLPDNNAIVIFTDANVFFRRDTIPELVRYFADERVGLVDAVVLPRQADNEMEKDYWQFESRLKLAESKAYATIPGPSGACYAIRAKLYTPVPDNFLVDDFFIGFSIAAAGYHTLLNEKAVCTEDWMTDWRQEFTRKSRIAAGNFQNLWYFKKQAWRLTSAPGFVFFSHKVLRWKTPFFLLILYYLLLLKFTLFILIVTFILPIVDVFLFTFGVPFKPLRRFHYFIIMNAAVLAGFIKFCKGIKSNVWQPTQRI